MSRNMVPLLDNRRGEDLVRNICEKEGVKFDAFLELVQWECEQIGKTKKFGMEQRFNEILDWIETEKED